MRVQSIVTLAVLITSGLGAGAVAGSSQAPDPKAVAERVAAFKKALQDDQMRLRSYEWIETTTVLLKGEAKSRKQNRVYYGADGKLQKIAVGNPPPAPQPPGGRGGRLKQRIVENKKEDMQEYMEAAAALIHMYVPPSPTQVQAARDDGRVAMALPKPGQPRLEFRDYLQRGDSMVIDLDAANNRLIGLTVATYLEKPDDPVNLSVLFAALDDGTGYTRQTTLEAKAKNVTVVIENSGFRPLAR